VAPAAADAAPAAPRAAGGGAAGPSSLERVLADLGGELATVRQELAALRGAVERLEGRSGADGPGGPGQSPTAPADKRPPTPARPPGGAADGGPASA
jgi:hypothetical protein